METVWEEIATEFEGEHPALPISRDLVEQMKKRLEELREQVQTTTGPLELPEPEEGQVELVREIVGRAMGPY